MQATPGNTNTTSSTLKFSTTSSTKLTTQPTTSTATKSFKASLTKRTTTSAPSSTSSASATYLKSSNSSKCNDLSASREIEEISKKISEHADAIYRTWKSRGLAPTELLDIYTNASATVQQPGVGGDIFVGSVVEAANAVNTTEGLQQFVNQFILKDKEQRASSNATNYIGGIGGYNIGQRTESLTSTRAATTASTTTTTKGNMPENIGNKIVGSGVAALKQPTLRTQKTGIVKPTSSSSSAITASSSAVPSSPFLTKTSNNQKPGEQTSVKKLAKSATSLSTTSNTTSSTTATPTSSSSLTATSLKNSISLKNVNSNNNNNSIGNIKLNATASNSSASTITAATPTTIKRNLGKTGTSSASATAAGVTTAAAAPILDINLNLNLDFDDLQLVDDVNSLKRLQTQNLKKIKALIKENEQHEASNIPTMTTATTTTIIKEPKPKASSTSSTTPITATKIATKTKKPNSTSRILSEIDGVGASTVKLKASKSLLNNEQIIANNNNNDIKTKKIVKNNKISSSNNNTNNSNHHNNNNEHNNNNSSLSDPNDDDDATIHKLISTSDKLNNSTNKQQQQQQQQQQKQQLDTKATTKAATKNSQVQVITSTTKNSTAMTPTAMMPTTPAAAFKRNETQTNQKQQQQQQHQHDYNDANVDEVDDDDDNDDYAVVQLAKQKATSTKLNSTKRVKKSFASDLNKSVNKNEKNNDTAAPTLKAAIVETAAATLNVIEMAQKQHQSEKTSADANKIININASIKNNSNTTSVNQSSSSATGVATTSSSSNSSSNTASNMPAPTKFKSGRTAPGATTQEKNLNRPFLTRGSVAERVLMFEKCPDVRNSFLNIKRPDPAEAPPKSLLKVKLHATPPPPPEQRSLQQELRTLKSVYIPRFYFPHGKPQPQIAQERTLRNILGAFDSFPNNQVTKDELPRILKLCGLPFYWRMPVMVFCQQQNNNTGLVERMRFVEFWKQMNVYCHDAASRFVYILSRGQRFRSYIMPEDLVPLVQDVVDTHPGLAFLKEATEFHSRYVHTVIARIFYSVNRCWSGKITMSELKKSDLLEIISLLEEEDDINQIMAFFSYEHFYVIYCKFWELDKDHDLLINQDDLARHSDHALSTRIVERIFSGCVTRSDKNKKTTNDDEPKMSYTDFVWFLLSEEDKRTPTAIEYWFRCMDLDGDGMLSMYELEYFYEEQQQRMESIGIETLPFEDCLCQMLDMIKPQQRDAITLGDLKRCKMTHVFFDTFFNLEKYLDHEQRDPFASQRDEYSSDWDRFAAQEYELLISEEND